ncbi:lipase maturation factor 1 isoform X2 [Leptonychotes weddellii]|uniref:Lipase maturation factor n=1 Tax=Leptonychotes weddellii TaxID=9713 RepID=A0A7F8RBV1_LEPWE|nr:lipase maturation factor 1 isoform X2 [Leptonychotes weddellii]
MECVPPSPPLCPVPVYPSVAAIHLIPLFPMSVWPVGAWLVAALPSDPEQSQLLAGDGWSLSSTGVPWVHTAPAPFILPGARAYAFQTPFWMLKQLHPGVMTACCSVNAASEALWPGPPGALEAAGVQKGLIKIRGDRCWRDLTCMDFHYEVVLIISGNLSFLNWLTMVPSMACFDDATLGFLFPSGPGGLKDQVLKLQEEAARGARPPLRYGCMVRRAVHVALGILVAWLSVPVVINLLSPTQVMNTSFNPLRIVNTYGAFGSITKERTEVILQGTASPNASMPDAVWEDYEFKCKPGDPGRRPCLISPYHHRLDWLMWFAAFQTYEHNEWIIHLAGRLLANDATAVSLLALNPFEDRAPPRWVRGEHYRYKFSRPGGQHAAAGKWWVRKRIGPYFPPLSLRDLEDYFRSREWPYPELE